MLDEISKPQISNFPSQSHRGGIKKKTDNLNNSANKVAETRTAYTPISKTLKTTGNIYSTPIAKTETLKQEVSKITTNKTLENQSIEQKKQNISFSLSIEEVRKQIQEFAKRIVQIEVKEMLIAMPLEVKKEAITLFTNVPEHENWANQVKNELLTHLQQHFQHHSLQILIRRPYTDSEKLYFLQQKYPKVNDLVNKLGLDLG